MLQQVVHMVQHFTLKKLTYRKHRRSVTYLKKRATPSDTFIRYTTKMKFRSNNVAFKFPYNVAILSVMEFVKCKDRLHVRHQPP
jgi:hypothetical protein